MKSQKYIYTEAGQIYRRGRQDEGRKRNDEKTNISGEMIVEADFVL
jgi:hypothetical protein